MSSTGSPFRVRKGIFLSTVAIALIVGLGIGSFIFPLGRASQSTVVSTKVVTVTDQGTGTNQQTITFTLETLEVYVVIPYCTTVSGKPTVEYSEAVGGTTTVTYTYSGGSLPPAFYGNVTTASTVGAMFVTQSSASC